MKNLSILKIMLVNFLLIGFVYAGNYDHTSDEWEIETYSSAAPDYIGNFATIIGGDGKIIREGTNGWTCMAANGRPYPKKGWENAHDAMPACSDKEAMKWMNAFMNNKKPELSKDGWMWMLHGDVGEDNLVAGVLNKKDSTPGEWIESGPHLMLIPKNIESLDNWNTDFTTGEPYVMFPGTIYAHVMIPVEGYYEYQKESQPK